MTTSRYLAVITSLMVFTCTLWARKLPFYYPEGRSEGPIESTDNPDYSDVLGRYVLGQLDKAVVIYSFTVLERNFPRAFNMGDSALEKNVRQIVESKLKSAEIPLATIQDWSKSRPSCPLIKVSVELKIPRGPSTEHCHMITTSASLLDQVSLAKDPNVIFYSVIWQKSGSDCVNLTERTLTAESRSVIEKQIGYLMDEFVKQIGYAKGYEEKLLQHEKKR